MRCWRIIIASSLLCSTVAAAESPKIQYWDQQRRGANCFNLVVEPQYFADAHAAGIGLIRLTWSKWKGAGRDFLLGDADNFEHIPAADLATLKRVLDDADARNIRIVVTPLSLPGCRWRQQNDGKFDDRLWTDEKFHQQSADFWRELAVALRDHPAVVGYNLINEPCPARALKFDLADHATRVAFEAKSANSPADVNLLYRRLIAAVREVDTDTPIILDACDFAAADAVEFLKPVDDAKTVYAVHCYEPWTFTNFKTNGGKVAYPGIDVLRAHLAEVTTWATTHKVPPTRIFLAEFGCDRRIAGADRYLADVTALANAFGWHWAFYAFREDEWDGFDYEVGTGKLPLSHWQAVERGEHPAPPRKDNPLWQVLARQFNPPN